MLVGSDNFVGLFVSSSHMTLNNPVLEGITIELVDKAKPTDFFITALGVKALIVYGLFTNSWRSSGSKSGYREV